jgi:hypothetical protein
MRQTTLQKYAQVKDNKGSAFSISIRSTPLEKLSQSTDPEISLLGATLMDAQVFDLPGLIEYLRLQLKVSQTEISAAIGLKHFTYRSFIYTTSKNIPDGLVEFLTSFYPDELVAIYVDDFKSMQKMRNDIK